MPTARELVSLYGNEGVLAERVKELMRERKMSQAQLARAMTANGHPMHQSAISKIVAPKNGDVRRAISIDEAIGFSKVFDMDLAEMLVSPEYFSGEAQEEAGLTLIAWRDYLSAERLQGFIHHIRAEYRDLTTDLKKAVAANTELRKRIEDRRWNNIASILSDMRAMAENDGDAFPADPAAVTGLLVENQTPLMETATDVLQLDKEEVSSWLR